MKIKMLVGISGTNGLTGKPWPKRGEVVDMATEHAAELVRRRLAEAVKEQLSVETNVVRESTENAKVKTDDSRAKTEQPAKRGRGRPRKNG